MDKNYIEVEEDGTPYDKTCEHGIHFGGYNCCVCHPEKAASLAWLFAEAPQQEDEDDNVE